MGNIKDIIASLKSDKEIEMFVQEQYNTIIDLSKKNSELEKKVAELQNLVPTEYSRKLTDPNAPEEVIIAEIQLARLNELSMKGILTPTDAKTVETYHKILQAFRGKEQKKPSEVENKSTAELLKLVHSEE